jgi:hypothetical protein
MLSEALQRNAKHEARLSNISDCWRRSRKISVVEQTNPRWLDLSDDWEQQPKGYDYPYKMEEMI